MRMRKNIAEWFLPKLQLLLFLFFVLWQSTNAARILAYFPMPWKSHQFLFRPLMRELANRGHSVDFYTPMPMPNPPRSLKHYVVKDWQEEVMKDVDEREMQTASMPKMQKILSDICVAVIIKTFTYDKASKDLLQSNATYDIVISEFPVGSEATAYLAHKFKALNVPIIGFPDYPWVNELAGLPDNPSYMIGYMYPQTDRLSFTQRLYNFYATASIIATAYFDLSTTQQIIADKYIRYDGWESRPKLTDFVSDNALILVNSHPSTAFPYPRAPHVKEISGMHIDPQTLPKDLQEFMDDAPNGIIYFSLGSVLDPSEILVDGKFEIFLNIFKKLKQKIIWKVAKGMPISKDPRIRMQTWYPQQAILGHKNIELFITHAGLGSTLEAISHGVPCLAMPFIFDQNKDAKYITSVGMGLTLQFDNVTETTLSWSINEILTNPSYRENARKRQALFHDRPKKPVDEAIYWIEYVHRHGKVLQPQSVRMPFYQVYLLDVLAAICAIAIAVIFIVIQLLTIFCASCMKSDSPKSSIKKKKQ